MCRKIRSSGSSFILGLQRELEASQNYLRPCQNNKKPNKQKWRRVRENEKKVVISWWGFCSQRWANAVMEGVSRYHSHGSAPPLPWELPCLSAFLHRMVQHEGPHQVRSKFPYKHWIWRHVLAWGEAWRWQSCGHPFHTLIRDSHVLAWGKA